MTSHLHKEPHEFCMSCDTLLPLSQLTKHIAECCASGSTDELEYVCYITDCYVSYTAWLLYIYIYIYIYIHGCAYSAIMMFLLLLCIQYGRGRATQKAVTQ